MDFVRIVASWRVCWYDRAWGFLGGRTTMPELPEVETMVRGLRPACWDGRLRRLEVRDPFLVQGCSARGAGAARPRCDGRARWVVGASGSS